MGQELDPFRNMCCAQQMEIGNMKDQGANHTYEYDSQFNPNQNWIVKIQAAWRGKAQSNKFKKMRDEKRKTTSQFLIHETMETVSRRRVIDI